MRYNLLTGLLSLGLLLPSITAQEQLKDPKLAALLEAVKQKDKIDARVQAIMDLADFGPKAAPVVPDLLEALQTRNDNLRINAALTLSSIGKPAVKPVADLLRATEVDTRFFAVWTIGLIGPDAGETIPVIIELMADKNVDVRRKAAFALGHLETEPSDRVMSALARACTDARADVRQAAGDALAKFGKTAAPTLLRLLADKDAKGRRQAATTLGDIGADAGEAVTPLIARCVANDSENPAHYAAMLAKVGRGGKQALVAALRDTRADVRAVAVQALAKLGAEGTPILVEGLGDKNVEVRRESAFTLMWTVGTLRSADKAIVLALGAGLADEDDLVRVHCINCLGAQPLAHLVRDRIKDALTDLNPHVRVQAYHTLSSLGENVNGMLQKSLESKNDRTRINTAALMCSVNFMRADAVPILVAGLKNDDLVLRMQAAHALRLAELERDKLFPVFLAGFKHKLPSVRLQAVDGLGWFLDTGIEAVPRVASALRDPDARVRQQAIHVLNYAIKNHQLEARFVVPNLVKDFAAGDAAVRMSILQVAWIYGDTAKEIYVAALKDKDVRVRIQVLQSLPNWTKQPAEFLPALIPLVKDESQLVREELVANLQRVGEASVPHLGELLVDEDDGIRRKASVALLGFGPKANKALRGLKIAIQDDNAMVRINVMVLLGQVGGEGPALLAKSFPQEPDAAVRSQVLFDLAALPDKTRCAPFLKLGIMDPALDVRHMTLNILGQFGPDSKEGLEVFAIAIKDADIGIRLSAIGFSGWFGEPSWTHIMAVLPSAKDARTRGAFLERLAVTKYRDKAAVPMMIEFLKDPDDGVRAQTCCILANIGPDAAKALPLLRGLIMDRNEYVQQAARVAVKSVEASKRHE